MNYGFTIKNIKAGYFATQLELSTIMTDLIKFNKGTLIEYNYEHDSLGRWHVHGTMIARKGLLLSRFKRPYTHIHIDPLKTPDDLYNWTRYIQKDATRNNYKRLDLDQQKKVIQQLKDEDYPFLSSEDTQSSGPDTI